jgi:hypothetical protein
MAGWPFMVYEPYKSNIARFQAKSSEEVVKRRLSSTGYSAFNVHAIGDYQNEKEFSPCLEFPMQGLANDDGLIMLLVFRPVEEDQGSLSGNGLQALQLVVSHLQFLEVFLSERFPT